jgi:hypothetical protein
MTSVGQRCCANGVNVRAANVRRHVWQRKRWRPAGRGPSFFTLAERQRGQCGILIPSQRKQYQQRGASLARCNFAVSSRPVPTPPQATPVTRMCDERLRLDTDGLPGNFPAPAKPFHGATKMTEQKTERMATERRFSKNTLVKGTFARGFQLLDYGQIGVSPELPYASNNGVSVRVVFTEVEAPESVFLCGLRGPRDAQ